MVVFWEDYIRKRMCSHFYWDNIIKCFWKYFVQGLLPVFTLIIHLLSLFSFATVSASLK